MTQQEQYWKELAEAAMTYIDKCPCDPDITPEQLTAWNELLAKRDEIPPAPAQGVEEAILALQKAIQMAEHDNEDPLATSWPEQTGVLISLSDAKKLLTGSRWQQGQEDTIKALSGEKVLPTETITTTGELPSQPVPTCCARWVSMPVPTRKKFNPANYPAVEIPFIAKFEWLGTEVVSNGYLTEIYKGERVICFAFVTPENKYGYPLSNMDYFQRLDESPCTCNKK